ncbi:MAG: HIT family protein [Immundisolibacterales bacterium]|nr:HIT family protein [Immundisolibacterales bacterium]
MQARENCIFCRIVAGTARSHPVWDDGETLAFMDLNPLAEGHVLVIPKPHWENLFETPAPALGAVMDTAKRMAHAIRATIAPPGLGVYQVNGRAAGQTVFHYHVHLIPRHDGISLELHGRRRADRADLERVAVRLRAALVPPG